MFALPRLKLSPPSSPEPLAPRSDCGSISSSSSSDERVVGDVFNLIGRPLFFREPLPLGGDGGGENIPTLVPPSPTERRRRIRSSREIPAFEGSTPPSALPRSRLPPSPTSGDRNDGGGDVKFANNSLPPPPFGERVLPPSSRASPSRSAFGPGVRAFDLTSPFDDPGIGRDFTNPSNASRSARVGAGDALTMSSNLSCTALASSPLSQFAPPPFAPIDRPPISPGAIISTTSWCMRSRTVSTTLRCVRDTHPSPRVLRVVGCEGVQEASVSVGVGFVRSFVRSIHANDESRPTRGDVHLDERPR